MGEWKNFLYVLTIQEQLEELVPNDDAYYLLYQKYYFHTQEWCEEQLGKLIIAVQRLLDLGFNEGYKRLYILTPEEVIELLKETKRICLRQEVVMLGCLTDKALICELIWSVS